MADGLKRNGLTVPKCNLELTFWSYNQVTGKNVRHLSHVCSHNLLKACFALSFLFALPRHTSMHCRQKESKGNKKASTQISPKLLKYNQLAIHNYPNTSVRNYTFVISGDHNEKQHHR